MFGWGKKRRDEELDTFVARTMDSGFAWVDYDVRFSTMTGTVRQVFADPSFSAEEQRERTWTMSGTVRRSDANKWEFQPEPSTRWDEIPDDVAPKLETAYQRFLLHFQR